MRILLKVTTQLVFPNLIHEFSCIFNSNGIENVQTMIEVNKRGERERESKRGGRMGKIAPNVNFIIMQTVLALVTSHLMWHNKNCCSH